MDGDGKLRLRQSGTDVRRHVVWPLSGMAIETSIGWNQALKEIAEVGGDIRIGILLNHQRG